MIDVLSAATSQHWAAVKIQLLSMMVPEQSLRFLPVWVLTKAIEGHEFASAKTPPTILPDFCPQYLRLVSILSVLVA
jgi:hypothetical protein